MNTLTIIKTTSGYVFGGFVISSWKRYGSYIADDAAFIFSLLNPFNKPVKIEVTTSGYAIYSYYYSGPTFGNGHDFYIPDNFNESTSRTSLNNSYKIPGSLNISSNLLLVGSSSFIVSELEVYQLEGIKILLFHI